MLLKNLLDKSKTSSNNFLLEFNKDKNSGEFS